MVSEYQKYKNWETAKAVLIGAASLVAVGFVVWDLFGYNNRPIAYNKPVPRPDYVEPSRIDIRTQDLNKDGDLETILKYRGNDYLFILDKGIPTCKEIK